MIKVIPFESWHAEAIDLQPGQRGEWKGPPDHGEAFTGVMDGTVVFCVGRAYGTGAWALLSKDAGKHLLRITRIIERLLVLNGDQRVEAYIKCDFVNAHRWISLFGFEFDRSDPATGFDIYVRS